MVTYRTRWSWMVGVTLIALLSACAHQTSPAADRTITLYTSITQQTVDAVVAAFHGTHPATKVTVFRAPTGAVNARIAADRRSGGLKADVLWLSDPLTMHDYDQQRLLRHLTPRHAAAIPRQYRSGDFWGAGLLYLVLVAHKPLAHTPTDWSDLTSTAYRGKVAIPDPGFAGSAMGALGYFAKAHGYGMGFYRTLRRHGAVQVKAPADVITGVAQGRYQVGMTIADSAQRAARKGSPIRVVWPSSGAIAIYSPIGVTAASRTPRLAESFVDSALSPAGQRAIAGSGRQPALPGIPGLPRPAGARVVSPHWASLFSDRDRLLRSYQSIFGI